MYKRKFEESESSYERRGGDYKQKHSLDSDEEDVAEDEDNILDEKDIEGEEEGDLQQIDGQRMTAFNMREEMEEGHFDREGHFIWKNEKEIRDNWLDNIDWQKISSLDKYKLSSENVKGLGDESSSDEDEEEAFDEIETYKSVLKYLKEKESVSKALNRLGGDTRKLSSIERLKRKKAGMPVSNKEVVELTELANKILTKRGNMDIYEETYEMIQEKIGNFEHKGKKKVVKEAMLDMYADDFDMKEKEKLESAGSSTKTERDGNRDDSKDTSWEFKWDLAEEKIEGPFSTQQMARWAQDGYFKTGVWVRKCGENTNFYSSNRIDFDLYF